MHSIRVFVVSALFFTSAHTVSAMRSSEEKKTHNKNLPWVFSDLEMNTMQKRSHIG